MDDDETSQPELRRKYPIKPRRTNAKFRPVTLGRQDLIDIGKVLSFNGPNLYLEADEWLMRGPVDALIEQFPNPSINDFRLFDESGEVAVHFGTMNSWLFYPNDEDRVSNAVYKIKHIAKFEQPLSVARIISSRLVLVRFFAGMVIIMACFFALRDQLSGRNADWWYGGGLLLSALLGLLTGWTIIRSLFRSNPVAILRPSEMPKKGLVRNYPDHIEIVIALAALAAMIIIAVVR